MMTIMEQDQITPSSLIIPSSETQSTDTTTTLTVGLKKKQAQLAIPDIPLSNNLDPNIPSCEKIYPDSQHYISGQPSTIDDVDMVLEDASPIKSISNADSSLTAMHSMLLDAEVDIESDDDIIDTNTSSSSPLPADSVSGSSNRVVAYRLWKDEWQDIGIGTCALIVNSQEDDEDDEEFLLVVYSENNNTNTDKGTISNSKENLNGNNQNIFFSASIQNDVIYKRENDTIITWMDHDDQHYAISFEYPQDCDSFWNRMESMQESIRKRASARSTGLQPKKAVVTKRSLRTADGPGFEGLYRLDNAEDDDLQTSSDEEEDEGPEGGRIDTLLFQPSSQGTNAWYSLPEIVLPDPPTVQNAEVLYDLIQKHIYPLSHRNALLKQLLLTDDYLEHLLEISELSVDLQMNEISSKLQDIWRILFVCGNSDLLLWIANLSKDKFLILLSIYDLNPYVTSDIERTNLKNVNEENTLISQYNSVYPSPFLENMTMSTEAKNGINSIMASNEILVNVSDTQNMKTSNFSHRDKAIPTSSLDGDFDEGQEDFSPIYPVPSSLRILVNMLFHLRFMSGPLFYHITSPPISTSLLKNQTDSMNTRFSNLGSSTPSPSTGLFDDASNAVATLLSCLVKTFSGRVIETVRADWAQGYKSWITMFLQKGRLQLLKDQQLPLDLEHPTSHNDELIQNDLLLGTPESTCQKKLDTAIICYQANLKTKNSSAFLDVKGSNLEDAFRVLSYLVEVSEMLKDHLNSSSASNSPQQSLRSVEQQVVVIAAGSSSNSSSSLFGGSSSCSSSSTADIENVVSFFIPLQETFCYLEALLDRNILSKFTDFQIIPMACSIITTLLTLHPISTTKYPLHSPSILQGNLFNSSKQTSPQSQSITTQSFPTTLPASHPQYHILPRSLLEKLIDAFLRDASPFTTKADKSRTEHEPYVAENEHISKISKVSCSDRAQLLALLILILKRPVPGLSSSQGVGLPSTSTSYSSMNTSISNQYLSYNNNANANSIHNSNSNNNILCMQQIEFFLRHVVYAVPDPILNGQINSVEVESSTSRDFQFSSLLKQGTSSNYSIKESIGSKLLNQLAHDLQVILFLYNLIPESDRTIGRTQMEDGSKTSISNAVHSLASRSSSFHPDIAVEDINCLIDRACSLLALLHVMIIEHGYHIKYCLLDTIIPCVPFNRKSAHYSQSVNEMHKKILFSSSTTTETSEHFKLNNTFSLQKDGSDLSSMISNESIPSSTAFLASPDTNTVKTVHLVALMAQCLEHVAQPLQNISNFSTVTPSQTEGQLESKSSEVNQEGVFSSKTNETSSVLMASPLPGSLVISVLKVVRAMLQGPSEDISSTSSLCSISNDSHLDPYTLSSSSSVPAIDSTCNLLTLTAATNSGPLFLDSFYYTLARMHGLFPALLRLILQHILAGRGTGLLVSTALAFLTNLGQIGESLQKYDEMQHAKNNSCTTPISFSTNSSFCNTTTNAPISDPLSVSYMSKQSPLSIERKTFSNSSLSEMSDSLLLYKMDSSKLPNSISSVSSCTITSLTDQMDAWCRLIESVASLPPFSNIFSSSFFILYPSIKSLSLVDAVNFALESPSTFPATTTASHLQISGLQSADHLQSSTQNIPLLLRGLQLRPTNNPFRHIMDHVYIAVKQCANSSSILTIPSAKEAFISSKEGDSTIKDRTQLLFEKESTHVLDPNIAAVNEALARIEQETAYFERDEDEIDDDDMYNEIKENSSRVDNSLENQNIHNLQESDLFINESSKTNAPCISASDGLIDVEVPIVTVDSTLENLPFQHDETLCNQIPARSEMSSIPSAQTSLAAIAAPYYSTSGTTSTYQNSIIPTPAIDNFVSSSWKQSNDDEELDFIQKLSKQPGSQSGVLHKSYGNVSPLSLPKKILVSSPTLALLNTSNLSSLSSNFLPQSKPASKLGLEVDSIIDSTEHHNSIATINTTSSNGMEIVRTNIVDPEENCSISKSNKGIKADKVDCPNTVSHPLEPKFDDSLPLNSLVLDADTLQVNPDEFSPSKRVKTFANEIYSNIEIPLDISSASSTSYTTINRIDIQHGQSSFSNAESFSGDAPLVVDPSSVHLDKQHLRERSQIKTNTNLYGKTEDIIMQSIEKE